MCRPLFGSLCAKRNNYIYVRGLSRLTQASEREKNQHNNISALEKNGQQFISFIWEKGKLWSSS